MGMSNGVWVSSACTAIMNTKKPTNCVSTYGKPMPFQPKIESEFCFTTICCRFMVRSLPRR